MLSLNSTSKLSFEPRFCILSLLFTKQKANFCSPWTPCYSAYYANTIIFILSIVFSGAYQQDDGH